MSDLISRQVAIDVVKDVCDAIMSGCESWYDPETEDEVYKDIREVDAILKCNKEIRIALRNMPSAQPEISRIEQVLHGKTPEEQYEFLYWLLFKFALTYTDSRLAVVEWLRGEQDE